MAFEILVGVHEGLFMDVREQKARVGKVRQEEGLDLIIGGEDVGIKPSWLAG